MGDFLDELYFRMMENDSFRAQACRKEAARAEPWRRKLIEALGEDEGGRIWEAAAWEGGAEAVPAFRAGLRFGLWLLAVCLEQ